MRISIETTKGLERRMTIAVPSDRVDTAVKVRLQEAAKTIRLNGFRKGKVPLKVVKNKFGEGVRREVVSELMNQTCYEAISQESLNPAGQPKIEPISIEEGQDLEFTAVFEVYPDIELPDFSKISAEKLTAEVTDADIDEMIETLRRQKQTWQTVDREAADEDIVNLDYVGKKDGEEFEGGAARGQDLSIGSGSMIPGFEEGLAGKKAGDTFNLPLTFPAEYSNQELAGAAVEFEIAINSVSERNLPEVDEKFFESFGVDEGGEQAFREEVTNNMRREMKVASWEKLKIAVMNSLLELVDMPVPKALLAPEIHELKHQMIQRLGGGHNMNPHQLPDEIFDEEARRRVVMGLVILEVMRKENIKADPEKVREAVEELAETYETPEEVVKWYYSDEEQLSAIESRVARDQVFDFIIEAADVKEKPVTYQELVQFRSSGETGDESHDDSITDEGSKSATENSQSAKQ